ncbi:sugar kinase [Lachnospiraceae bacterium 62-35]
MERGTVGRKVVTLGEIMLRLSTPGYRRFIQSNDFNACYGGSEANVAVSLANYGYEAEFITAVPDNPIGECAIAALRKHGVKTEHIAKGGERLGIYFLESGSAMRAGSVIYDRAHSSFSTAVPEDFNFDKIFKGADWFHFSGITPAVSDNGIRLTEAALQAAKAAGVTISVDLNFRKKLWTSEKARKVMTGLMKYVDVCIGNEEDGEKALGFQAGTADVTKGELDPKSYERMFNQMADQFGFQYIASSLRQSYSASHNGWSACIMDGRTRKFYHSRTYSIDSIIDRVGSGDSFAAGLICGLLDGKTMEQALDFAAAASALKHTIPGDFNLVTREEAESLAEGDDSGRVKR